MGCGSSKGAATVFGPMLMTPVLKPAKEPHGCIVTVRESPSANIHESPVPTATTLIMPAKRTNEFDMNYGSLESLTSNSKAISEASHYGSAESKDSGLGEDVEFYHIITEKSSPRLKHVADVPEELPEADLDDSQKMRTPGTMGHLKRNTTRLPPVFSRNKKTKEEAVSICLEAILQKRVKFAGMLIDELPTTNSIFKRPVSRGGVAFDIFMGCSEVEKEKATSEGEMRKKLPPCVRNYAKQQKLTNTTTQDDLEEKQRAAEQRRKECEQMRLERIWARQEKDKQIAEALAKFATMQINMKTRSESAKDNIIHDHVTTIR